MGRTLHSVSWIENGTTVPSGIEGSRVLLIRASYNYTFSSRRYFTGNDQQVIATVVVQVAWPQCGLACSLVPTTTSTLVKVAEDLLEGGSINRGGTGKTKALCCIAA